MEKLDSFSKVSICSSTLLPEATAMSEGASFCCWGLFCWAKEKWPACVSCSPPSQEREKNSPKTKWPLELANKLKPVFCKASALHHEYWSFSYTFAWLSRSLRKFFLKHESEIKVASWQAEMDILWPVPVCSPAWTHLSCYAGALEQIATLVSSQTTIKNSFSLV